MRKYVAIFLTLICSMSFVGCFSKDKNSEENTNLVTVKSTRAQEDNQAKSEVLEILSDEDKAVKAEIAKYYDTKIDFRFQKHEKFNGETYDLKFSKMGCITSSDILSNVTYKGDNGDEVSYDLETGNITMAYFRSKETSKTTNSIDIVKAESIAYDYASKKCDIKQYVIEEKEERDNGYMFSYCKYIYGYRTNDSVRVLIGFDGSVVWTTIRFYTIDENKFDVDKNWFELEIQKTKSASSNIVIESALIEKEQNSDKIFFDIKYNIIDDFGDIITLGIEREEIPMKKTYD